MKLQIPKNNWYDAGIYKISTTTNKRFYIGSAKNLYQRHASHKHLMLKGTHPSKQLQAYINKHGIDNLIFELVEIVPDITNLINREQYYFDTLNPFGMNGYNTLRKAENMLGFKHSEATKEKYRNRKPNYPSEEAKKRISEMRKGVSRPDNVKKMLTERSKKRRKEIYQFDLSGNLIRIFLHSREAESETKTNRGNILGCCKGKNKIVNKFIFLYPNDPNIIDGKIKKEELERRLDNVYRPDPTKSSKTLKAYYKSKRDNVLMFDFTGKLIKQYDDYLIAAKENNVSRTVIGKCIKGDLKTSNGHIFKNKKDCIDDKILKDELEKRTTINFIKKDGTKMCRLDYNHK